MNDNTTPDLLAAVAAQLAQLQQQGQTQGQPATGGGWAQLQQTQQQGAGLPIQGVAVPVALETPIGKIRVYLSLPAECGRDPAALLAALEALAIAGWPLDAWRPKESGGGGWGKGGNGGGGWNRGGNSRGRW